ncbi:MAG: aminotransferase class III-fold pyridoxal phosphate-dependent enzyme [Propionibacteriaceae bacterium]|jgi:predicted amino acid dehydrogenase/acetylornithine/succinyldiaminopimelate/putrescine aminotransferase|nr:aminotransferase class III-fold pyridoxal phosphate-dependent enzyme [Propionibacteriaceae bacterium]
MKFGFLAHPTTRREKNYVRAVDLLNKLIDEGEHGYRRETWRRQDQVRYMEAGTIRSAAGAECSGLLYEFPLTAEEIMADVAGAQESVARAVEALAQQGAQLVGLGGTTSIVGGRGVVTARNASVPVTSGNSLTAFAAHAELLHTLQVLGRTPEKTRVVVLGYPGSIALAVARLLVAGGFQVDLVHSGRSSEDVLWRHLGGQREGIQFFDNVSHCYERAQHFVTATSVGGVIDENRLLPGSVVVDVALPRDVRRATPPRTDVLTIDGGFVSAAPAVLIGASLASLTVNRHLNGCLAETMILGLEGRAESFSIGRDLPVEKVLEIGAIAEKHGFSSLPMSSWEEPISDDDLGRLAQFHKSPLGSRQPPETKGRVLERFRRYADRLLVNHMAFNYIDMVVDTGNGCLLASDEAAYLDMDACHGAAVLGHNPASVMAGITDFARRSSASAANHVTVQRQAGLLCERLSDLIPGPDRSITLTTSGEEAIQSALRTAHAATGRAGFVRVDVFKPARDEPGQASSGIVSLPGSVAADRASVDAAVDESVGVVFIEPFVDEAAPGGAERAAAFYQAVQALCRQRGVVFAVDERLTAWRTAPVFAAPALGLDPDIICLGESLGSATIPLGAACIRQELWELASRHFPGAPVALSPLGGNDLSAVAGLRTLDEALAPGFWDNVRETGALLREGLLGAVARFAFARQAMGAGLLWHLRCSAPFDQALEGLRDDLTARSPGALRTMIRELPVSVRDTATLWSGLFSDALEQFLFDRVNTKLAQDHRILIDRTRRHPRTLLISPPLVISPEQVNSFVDALHEVFADLSTFDVLADR